ncbi:MAG: hypothetical protein E7638_06755 [Ruminococcaceae bacterium]|nr:hypothetical protein [Oscillospiraceae bacterium]
MGYGVLCGVIVLLCAENLVLVWIIERMVSYHLRMVQQRTGLKDTPKGDSSRVISPYRAGKKPFGGDAD